MIRARAPVRISFGGGGTDISPYMERHGGLILSTTINQYAYCSVTKSPSFHFESNYDGSLDFPKAAVKRFGHSSPVSLSLFSEAPPGSGLGGSSSVMVATVKALAKHYNVEFSRQKLAEYAYYLEREDLGLKGGWQDQFAAAYGGFNLMEFSAKGTKVVPLKIDSDIRRELLASLVLVDLGRSRLSSDIVSRQIETYHKEAPETLEALSKIKDITRQMMVCLLAGNVKEMGELLTAEWFSKKTLDKRISNSFIDGFHSGMLREGAIGGKLLGAGEGGHMVFLCDIKNRRSLLRFVENSGARYIPFSFEGEGVQAWTA